MLLKPATVEELQGQLADASTHQRQIEGVNLSALNRIIEYTPEDMVVTVQTGITLDSLQMELRKHNQWLPIDPPETEVTIEEIISGNLSGPRRLGFGTIRDHLLGLMAVLGDGTRISGGGKVVKNVAGFDLPKLFVGARGTLGIPVQASFKLLPSPEAELFLGATLNTISSTRSLVEKFAEKRLWPASLDLYQLETFGPIILLAGFAGAREDVQTQIGQAREIGLNEQRSLEEQRSFWSNGELPQKISVLSSELFATIEKTKPNMFLARVGNGILYYRGGTKYPPELQAPELMKRLKQAYDPKGVLPSLAL